MAGHIHDLTRHDGGDVVGGRLPADPVDRLAVAVGMVGQALDRWHLGGIRQELEMTVYGMLRGASCIGGCDLVIRCTPTHVVIRVGTALNLVALHPVAV